MKIKLSPTWADMNQALLDLGKPKPRPTKALEDFVAGDK